MRILGKKEQVENGIVGIVGSCLETDLMGRAN